MKKRSKLKKGLSILLTAAMVVGLVPGGGTLQVSATELDENTVNTVSSNDTMTPEPTDEQTTGKLITTWQWIDEEEYLDEETGNLALPGASEQTPAYFDDVISFLPTQIQATVVNADDSENPETGVEKTISLGDWSCDSYPEEGAYSGNYTFSVALPEGYALSEEAEALTVLVELGGAQMWYDSGSLGNGLSWTLNDDGTLTICGEGDIPDANQWWDGQATSVKEIVIEEGVTGIGDMGLCQCTNLTSVTIPLTVTSIGKNAFLQCTSLTTVSFADECVSTLSIGDRAFNGCTALESIEIPNYVTTLGYGAFEGCRILQSVTFEAGSQLKAISGATFYGCDKLETINIPSSVESIGDSAFGYCTSLKSITIPDSVTTIDRAAFWGCSALESIMIPESVTTIGDDIFKECSNLKKVTCISGSYAETYLREKYPELLTVLYKVTINSDPVEGYTITQADKTAFPESGQLLTDADGSLSFRIEAAYGYNKNFTVKADGTEVTAVDGVYTISGITENKTIALTIEGAGPCSHSKYNNGFCTECDAYEPAVYNESKNYYEISNTGQLYWFAGLVNGDASVCTGDVTKNPSANAVLMKSITVNEGVLKSDGTLVDGVSGFTSWTPIGNYGVNCVSYAGTFDGQGFTISGLYCVAENTDVGFVGNSSGTIKNLGITNSYFKGKESVGAVCGKNVTGFIVNCFSASYIDATDNNAGGVCGTNQNSGTIINCYNMGSVTAISDAHSICGTNQNSSTITNCFFLDTKPSDGYATGKSEELFNSGEVAYLLSQGTDGEVWGQKLGENGDAYPVLKKEWDEGNTVYQNRVYSGCSESNPGDTTYVYANNAADPVYAEHIIGENGICSICNQKIKYKVSLTSTVDGADEEDTVALLTGGGLYTIGTEVTVTAPEKEGFTFNGWYNLGYGENDKPRSEKLSYTFTPEVDTSLVAVYVANASITLNVNGERDAYSVNGTTQTSNSFTQSFKAGSSITVAYTGSGTFCYWKNESGKIVSKNPEYTFTIVNVTTLTAVVAGDSTGSEETGYSALVEFVSCYGQIIEAATWNSKDTVAEKTLPAAPSKLGGTFKYWSLDGTNEATAATILAAINGSTTRITVVPVYEEIKTTYSVTVKYPSGSGKADAIYDNQKLGNTLTLTADSIEGKEFAYWSSDAEGTTKLSYSQSYFLLVSGNTTLYPIYSDTAVEEQPVVAITNVSRNTVAGKNKLSFEVTRSIPAKYELVEQGVIYSVSDNYVSNEAAMVIGAGSVYKFVSSDTGNNGVFIANMNVTGHEASKLYVKGYVVIKNKETGNIETIYTDMAAKSYNELSQN